MQKQTNRAIVAAVLITAGVVGGFFVFDAQRRSAVLDSDADGIVEGTSQLIVIAADIGSAQQAYVAPGQPHQPWLDRGAMLLQEFGQQVAGLRPQLQSADARNALDEVLKNFKSILTIDDHARQDMQTGEELLAADLIFSEGRDALSAIVNALRATASAEKHAATAQHASAERKQLAIVAGIAAAWLVGILLLVRVPRAPAAADANVPLAGLLHTDVRTAKSSTAADASPCAVDLAEAADVCSALARTTDTASLQSALGRAAAVLDARGVIVWMGAGEELFPALSHGYEEGLVERFGPIPRDAANATAEAWRSAQMRTVAGDVMANGAVAAPVMGVDGCIGVFTAEVRNGREADAGSRAVATMIASQLAGLLSAWPAGSAAEVHKTA